MHSCLLIWLSSYIATQNALIHVGIVVVFICVWPCTKQHSLCCSAAMLLTGECDIKNFLLCVPYTTYVELCVELYSCSWYWIGGRVCVTCQKRHTERYFFGVSYATCRYAQIFTILVQTLRCRWCLQGPQRTRYVKNELLSGIAKQWSCCHCRFQRSCWWYIARAVTKSGTVFVPRLSVPVCKAPVPSAHSRAQCVPKYKRFAKQRKHWVREDWW